MSRITVIGSANIDFVVELARRPEAGETLLGSDLRRFAGGKGANQAAAAARMGAHTSFYGCIGDDENGAFVRSKLVESGVDIEGLIRVRRPTGTALILVTPDGENSIVVSPGANHALDVEVVESTIDGWADADIVVLNLESPLQTVEYVAAMANKRGIRVLLNAAPAEHVTAKTLALCDPLIVNEHEARALLDDRDSSPFAVLAQQFLDRGVRSIVITLGAAGAIVGDLAGIDAVPAFAVNVIDTTGAGDAFVGATACELAGGSGLRDAVIFASGVAALSVQTMGAQSSYPFRSDISNFLID